MTLIRRAVRTWVLLRSLPTMSQPTYIVFTNPPSRQAVRRYIQIPPETSEHPFKKVKLRLDWHTTDIANPPSTVSSLLCDRALIPSSSSPRSAPLCNTLPRPSLVDSDTASSYPKGSHESVVEATFDESFIEGQRGSEGFHKAVITAAERRKPQQKLDLVVEGKSIETASKDRSELPTEERNEIKENQVGDMIRALESETKLAKVVDSSAKRDQNKSIQEQPSDLDYTSIILPADYQTFPPVTSYPSSNSDPALRVTRQTRSSQSSSSYPDMTTSSLPDRTRPNIVKLHKDTLQNTTPVDCLSHGKSQEEVDNRQDTGESSILHSTKLEEAMMMPVTATTILDKSVHQHVGRSVNDETNRPSVSNLGIDSTSLDMYSIRELGATSFSFTVTADTSAAASAANPCPFGTNVDPAPNDSTRSTREPRRSLRSQTSSVASPMKKSSRGSNRKEDSQSLLSVSRETAQPAVLPSTSLLGHVDRLLETSPATRSTCSFQSSTESSFLPTQTGTQSHPSDPSSVHSETSVDQAQPPHAERPQITHPTHPYIHSNLLRPLPSFAQPLDQSTANFLAVVTSVELKSFVGKDRRSWLLGELELFDGKNVGRLAVWGEEAKEWCNGVEMRKGDVVLFERITIIRPKPPSPVQTLRAYPLDPHLSRPRPRTLPISTYTIFYRTSPPLSGESTEAWESKRADLRWRSSDTGLGLVGRLKDWVESAGV